MDCNSAFLEKTKYDWESQRNIVAADFPRLLALASRVGDIDLIEEENKWLRQRMCAMAGSHALDEWPASPPGPSKED